MGRWERRLKSWRKKKKSLPQKERGMTLPEMGCKMKAAVSEGVMIPKNVGGMAPSIQRNGGNAWPIFSARKEQRTSTSLRQPQVPRWISISKVEAKTAVATSQRPSASPARVERYVSTPDGPRGNAPVVLLNPGEWARTIFAIVRWRYVCPCGGSRGVRLSTYLQKGEARPPRRRARYNLPFALTPSSVSSS